MKKEMLINENSEKNYEKLKKKKQNAKRKQVIVRNVLIMWNVLHLSSPLQDCLNSIETEIFVSLPCHEKF